ncbi:hypothetical protein CYLTODRAFT_492248 [Cylindrobasidium torrendii FP15055 ss-10]|uniref:Uncharacterized protein n=1 Tax=Cylindrobasidium torrendii FP15055 ss-10 TaxID=1314674 RepID=A0A0D7B5Q9_9AGAR|nr:hypothetical protein CYLTODRAFT_492248 [Cylindrobasidium torrendii FP15055 ss-10]
MSERRRFDEVPELQQDYEYTLEIIPRFQKDIFLKHPLTGAVTIHQHPYNDMPRFRLLTAHPSLVSVAAERHLYHFTSGPRLRDPLTTLARLRDNIVWPPREYLDLYYSIKLPPRKRKAGKKAEDPAPSSKRARKTKFPEVTKTSLSSRETSPGSRTSRKRKTQSDANALDMVPAKRARARPARPQCTPVVVSNLKAEGKIASPCRPSRPVRAAKSQAVIRMAKVV